MSNIKVTVQDANNVLLEVTPVPIQQIAISRGVAGRGVADVTAVEIDNALYLEFTFTDGTTETVGPVGTIQYIGQSPIVVTGSTISLSTVPVNLGGTGQVTANAGFNALAPSQTSNAGKYLKTDGTNAAWDLLDISTADITGVLPIANGGTNAATAADARTNLNAANQDTTISAGTGLSGGGSLADNRTISIANTTVTAASYGAASKTLTATVNAQGQLTALADTPIAIANTQISGLGTMSTQDANAVAITGGSITGITDLAVQDGGTGASTAAGAMVNLLPSYTGNANKRLGLDSTASGLEWVTDGGGTVTSVDVSGGTTGLSFTGGPVTTSGTFTLSGTLDVDNGGTGAIDASGARTNLGAAASATTISAGTGLSGGGDLSANRTLSIANTAVTAGSYGSASNTLSATVNAQGQLTALAATPIAIANTQVSGLGTMSTQNANAVAITGGSITGITDLAVDDGGTGASDALGARTNLGAAASAITISAGTGLSGGGDLTVNRTLSIANTAVTAASYGSASDTLTATVNAQGQLTALAATPIAISNTQISGLGTMSTQNSNAVTITGGSITGITDLAIVDGGTGASTAADARSNLGLGTAAVLNAGVANGVATLDAGGTVPLSQIPASIQGGVSYQGAWNASTNTPTLTSSVGTKGHYYVVSVSGNTNLNGVTDWLVGDWAIYNGSAWEKIDNTDQVASVNGYTGVVVLSNTDVGAPSTSLTISAGTGLTGGGDLTTNRTISIANTAVSAGSYGTASAVPSFTVNGQGQLTAAANTTIAIANTQVSGLGTMSTQNANAVAITGGTATLTSLTVNDNTTLGSSNTDQVTFTARVASEFSPTTANTYDLGRNSHEWRNLYLTGTANISALTASGAVTLSGATANGVVYANGSKVLTTGSALTFDGTNFATTGAGSFSGVLSRVHAQGTDAFLTNTTTGKANTVVGFNDSGATNSSGVVTASSYFGTLQNYPLAFISNGSVLNNSSYALHSWNVAGSEQMRLTSTGLGIGTSSPATLLHLSSSSPRLRFTDTDGAGEYSQISANSTSGALVLQADEGNTASGTYLGFSVDGSERMRITSAGNVGIGTSSPAYKLDVAGDIQAQGRLLVTAAAPELLLSVPSGGLDSRIYNDGSGNLIFGNGTNSATPTERMRIDSAGNVGIGTSSPNELLQIKGSANGDGITLQRSSTTANDYAQLGFVVSTNDAGTPAAWIRGLRGASAGLEFLTFGTSNTEYMRLDSSGNLGIGTSSPGAKLDVSSTGNGNRALFSDTTNDNTLAVYSDSANIRFIGLNNARSSYKEIGVESNGFRFKTSNGSFSALLDSSGNFGLGVTPSAWRSEFKVFQLNARTSLFGSADSTFLSTNEYIDSAGQSRYIQTGSATRYRQDDRSHIWSYAASGTAGNAITFTQAMTLDASGRLGIGTTSPDEVLVVKTSAGNVKSSALNSGAKWVGTNAANNAEAEFGLQGNPLVFLTNGSERARIDSSGNLLVGSTNNPGTRKLSVNGIISVQDGSNERFFINWTAAQSRNEIVTVGANSTTFWTNSVERMRIDSSGNVGIGASSPLYKLTVIDNGSTLYFRDQGANAEMLILSETGGTSALYFGDAVDNVRGGIFYSSADDSLQIRGYNNAERMRIDSSGNLLVGQTSHNQQTVGFSVTPSGIVSAAMVASTSAANCYHLYSTGAAAYRFYVGLNGTINATSTTISAISDIRFKENVRDLDVGLDKIMALKPRLYDWKAGKGADIKNARGFIAQEFEEVFPDLIDEWLDPAPEGEEPYKSVRADLIPVLVKAIQEQQAIIESLKARLDAANL